MSWTATTIPPEHLPAVWPIVAPLLAPAMVYSGGRYDMRALFRSIRDKIVVLWVVNTEDMVVRAAFVSRVASYPCRSFLAIDFLGGEALTEWVGDVDATLERYCTDAGLSGIEFYGRPGWGKPLKPFGWRQNIVLHEKDVAPVGAVAGA